MYKPNFCRNCESPCMLYNVRVKDETVEWWIHLLELVSVKHKECMVDVFWLKRALPSMLCSLFMNDSQAFFSLFFVLINSTDERVKWKRWNKTKQNKKKININWQMNSAFESIKEKKINLLLSWYSFCFISFIDRFLSINSTHVHVCFDMDAGFSFIYLFITRWKYKKKKNFFFC